MRLKDKVIDISRWDSYSFIILIIAIMFQAFKWRISPIFLDVYYHLLTAVGFNEAGGWLGSCFWEFAPTGRPQLYPPLLHIIMLFFLKLGMPVLVIGKLVQFLIYPLLIFVVWYVVRMIFNKRLAFFTLFLLFSVYSFYLVAINTLAASLSLIFCLLSFLFLEKDRILTSALLFAIAFYTHGFTPWLFLGVFILYGVLYRSRLKSCIKIVLLALLLASPFIIYQVTMRAYYVLQNNLAENYYLELNIFHWFIFLFGLISCLKKKDRYYIFVSLFFAFIFLVFCGFIFRYLSFYGIMSMVFINAVFLDSLYEKLTKKSRKTYLIAILVLFLVLSPTLSIDLMEKDKKEGFLGSSDSTQSSLIYRKGIFTLNPIDSSLFNFVFYCVRFVRSNEVTIYFPRLFSQIVDVITKSSDEGDIIYTNFPYTGGILGLLSHRATSSAMLSEIRPYKSFDKIAVSKLIIWQKDPMDMKREPLHLIKKYKLSKIADTEMAFIYKNSKCMFKKKTLSATISYKLLFILFFLVFVSLVWSRKMVIDK